MELSKILPISEISEIGQFWITSYDTITFGFKIDLPEVYTLGKLDAELVYKNFLNAFSKLGNNVIVQKYGLFWKSEYESNLSNTESLTIKANEMHYSGRPIMDAENYIFVSFYFGTKKISDVVQSGKKFKKIIERNFVNLKSENISEFQKLISSFEMSLKSFLPKVDRLNSDEMLFFLERYLSADYKPKANYDYHDFDLRDGLNVGGRELSIFSMRNMPSSFEPFSLSNGKITISDDDLQSFKHDLKLDSSFLFPFGMGLAIPHLLIETFVLLGNEAVEAVLEKELEHIRFLISLGRQDAINKKDVIQEFLQQTAKNDNRSCKYGFAIIVPHTKVDKLKVVTQVVDVGSSHDVLLFCETRNNLKSFIYNTPGSGHCLDLKFGWLESYIKTLALETPKNGERAGIKLVDLFGKPFVFDFWDDKNKYLEARNGVLFAPTGAGKSFTTNTLLDACFNLGDNICIIDVGGSYKRTTEINKGQMYDSKKINVFSFNPFDLCFRTETVSINPNKIDYKYFPMKDSNGENDSYFIDFLANLILSIWITKGDKKISIIPQTKVLVKDSLKMYYNWINESNVKGSVISPSFDTYYNYVTKVFAEEVQKDVLVDFNISGFALMTKEYLSEGTYGFLLNSQKHISLENRWICFDMFALDGRADISAPVMLLVMDLVQRKLNSLKGQKLRLFIDEAIDFLQDPVFGDFLGQLYRKIRKMGGQVFIITQSITYLDNLDPMVSNSILSNSHIKILLDHSTVTTDIPLLQEKLSLSEGETELLYNMKIESNSGYKIGFMKFGSMPGFLFRIDVSKTAFAVYQTNAESVAKIDEYRFKSNNIESAISTFVENLDKK